MISFFEQDPSGDRFFPSDNDDKDKSVIDSSMAWVDTLYTSLWVGLTLVRAAIACATLYICFIQFRIVWKSGYPAIDTCGALRNIKSISVESGLLGLSGSMYTILAMSQMCESSGRKLSSLIYILPLMLFASKHIWQIFSTWLLTFNTKENYLDLVNMPDGHFLRTVSTQLIVHMTQLTVHIDRSTNCLRTLL